MIAGREGAQALRCSQSCVLSFQSRSVKVSALKVQSRSVKCAWVGAGGVSFWVSFGEHFSFENALRASFRVSEVQV